MLIRLVLNIGVADGRGFAETAPHERPFAIFGAVRFRGAIRCSVFGVRFYHRKFRARSVRWCSVLFGVRCQFGLLLFLHHCVHLTSYVLTYLLSPAANRPQVCEITVMLL